jgi:hypothetical protein
MIFLPPLTLGRYQFGLILQEEVNLPPYLGAMLRGGFGLTFKHLVCMQSHLKRCTDCVLLHTCAYPAVFEPMPPPDTQVLRTHARIPLPYLFEPPPWREAAWGSGEMLRFNLTLIGQGITYLPYFVLAFQALGRRGLTNERIRADLCQVVAVEAASNEHVPLWQAESLRRDWMTAGRWQAEDLYPTPHKTISTLTLHFRTPTRLKHNGRFVEKAPPFHVVVRTLLRRVSSLSYFHAGERWETDYQGWIARAQQVEMTDAHVSWVDWERYSTRQQQPMNLGGIVGRVTYGGDASTELGTGLAPFLPLVRLGELIHVGKGAVFGNGQYAVEIRE